jgi:hypothetical protein
MQLTGTGASGIIGFSFSAGAKIPSSQGNPILQNLLGSIDESSRYFSFHLGRDEPEIATPSILTVGTLNSALAMDMSNFSFTPVSKAGANDYLYWKLPLLSMTINSTSLPLTASRISGATYPLAVLDSGTTLILGPKVDVDRLWQSLGPSTARKNLDTQAWEVKCNKAVVLGLTLGEDGNGKEYTLDPSDVSWYESSSSDGWCLSGIQSNDNVGS